MQAKDLADAAVLALLDPDRETHRADIHAALPDVPPKVVLAKLRALIRRGLIDGCACGCGGEFTLTTAAQQVAAL